MRSCAAGVLEVPEGLRVHVGVVVIVGHSKLARHRCKPGRGGGGARGGSASDEVIAGPSPEREKWL